MDLLHAHLWLYDRIAHCRVVGASSLRTQVRRGDESLRRHEWRASAKAGVEMTLKLAARYDIIIIIACCRQVELSAIVLHVLNTQKLTRD
jgi:urease alpha subunit